MKWYNTVKNTVNIDAVAKWGDRVFDMSPLVWFILLNLLYGFITLMFALSKGK